MHMRMRILPVLALAAMATAATAVVVERALRDVDPPVDGTMVRVQALALKIDAFALDLKRLPLTLDELLQSPAPGWRGPYATRADLIDPAGTPIRYEIVDGGSGDYRLAATRHCPPGASLTCPGPAIYDTTVR